MPRYLFTGSYTAEGARGVLAKGGSARRDAVAQLMQSLGGRLESFDFALGSDDYFIIADLPGNEAAAAGALSVSSTGTSRTRTVALLTPDEVDAAARLTPTYRAPGS